MDIIGVNLETGTEFRAEVKGITIHFSVFFVDA
jgi:hypothetical protein